MLLEIIAAFVIISTILLTVVPALSWITSERRAAQRHEEALAEANSLLDRVTSQPWTSITPDALKAIQLSETVQKQLPGAAVKIDVETPPADPDVRRITLRLDWKNKVSQASQTIRLVAWVYRQEAAP